ncbi:CYTH and CHAD domain-containing protein [Corynebacterium uropygiale]|uniref:CYTH and CHAD domain-containing protein n=1 Tax=Corynebacterium uropygiale TaxID=1775911 RepID=A0A9X1QMT5_9CORY|nr:CYTH and CHAD domain-containing protein [Corynebacterium uropygiale]
MGTRSFVEIESKFSVTESAAVPDLTRIHSVDTILEKQSHSLSAVYYDTEDLRLTRARITLRRREGGTDAGWHIKLPGERGRIEIRAELGEPVDGEIRVPEEIRAHVRALIRRKELVPIAQVDNERTEYLLGDAAGSPLAEFCDDHVTAWSFLPGGKQSSWREWEVELAQPDGDEKEQLTIMRTATALLIGAGARASKSPSKLMSALGESIANAPTPPSEPEIDEDSPAAGVLAALEANRDKLVDYDPRVRRDEWDSVHQMRVATRELRSHLQTFEGILRGETVTHIESELKLLAGVLGQARDAEVVEERFRSLLEEEDSDALDDVTRQHIGHDMAEEYRRAHRRVVKTLDSDRYLDLLDALDELILHPPLGAPAEETAEHNAEPATESVPESAAEAGESAGSESDPQKEDNDTSAAAPLSAEDTLLEHVEQAYKKLRKRHKAVIATRNDRSIPLTEREEHLHDMRKAAKRLRYSAEAVGAATGLKTKKLAKACKEMQSLLGDFQDAVTSREIIQRAAAKAQRRGESTFGYGMLYQRERMHGLEALRDYDRVAEDIRKAHSKLRRKK